MASYQPGNNHRRRGAKQNREGSTDSITVGGEGSMRRQRVDRHQKCGVCSRLPYRGTDMLVPLMYEQDGNGLAFDEGIYEYIYRMAHPDHEDSARVDHDTAVKTKDRCSRHKRKLQSELVKAGILEEAGQKYTGNNNRARMIAPFYPEEIMLGAPLGTGGFSTVYEIDSFRPDKGLANGISVHEHEAREYLTKNAQRPIEPDEDIHPRRRKKNGEKEGTIARYALKHLRRGLTKEPERFERAAIDLVLEAQLLLAMDHPNIISLRGGSGQGVAGYESGRHTGFFIIIDRLPETLEDRILSWRASLRKYKNRFKLPWGKVKYSSKMDFVLCERLQVAHDVAAALEYMHDRRIINRDMKATNIGFDIYGEVKLFDFGLSRLLPSKKENKEDTYLMSRVGTKYYMAPEIRKKVPYGLSADVYSYGICLWEILSVGSPREALKKVKDSSKNTALTRCPLPICKCWPEDISNLMKACFAISPIHRPPAAEVRYILEQLTEQFMGNLGLKRRIDTRQRRSTLRIDLSLLVDTNTSQGSSDYGESTLIEESICDHDFVGGTLSENHCSIIETTPTYGGRTRIAEAELADAETKQEITVDNKLLSEWTKSTTTKTTSGGQQIEEEEVKGS
mmetsp:Transcript_18978/g.24431  ORF Transcript_18978/g.24431 Transcript_18978/m.24431 type:complete len:622 (+) Transcript_18978:187-2052(+)